MTTVTFVEISKILPIKIANVQIVVSFYLGNGINPFGNSCGWHWLRLSQKL